MSTIGDNIQDQIDPAAVFAAALSLWRSFEEFEKQNPSIQLNEHYNGYDELMRVCMRVANHFELWACRHVAFAETDEVWPYLLEEVFGKACVDEIDILAIDGFDYDDCLRIAVNLKLPIFVSDELRAPVNVTSVNPGRGSPFTHIRVQSVRDSVDGNIGIAYSCEDYPFDEAFEEPYYTLSGIADDALIEVISTRETYSEASNLARKIWPGIAFPTNPSVIFMCQ
ncbi:MAG: hypothetical protein HZA51_02140 [Planctomycetes bacterium]|nr:hypothetical protein [Planctomycetota bacterium]